MIRPRVDHSGPQRSQPERHVAGRREPFPEEHERQKLAHEEENSAHQPNSGRLNWLITLEKRTRRKPNSCNKLRGIRFLWKHR
jgi:hypothetical protein